MTGHVEIRNKTNHIIFEVHTCTYYLILSKVVKYLLVGN